MALFFYLLTDPTGRLIFIITSLQRLSVLLWSMIVVLKSTKGWPAKSFIQVAIMTVHRSLPVIFRLSSITSFQHGNRAIQLLPVLN